MLNSPKTPNSQPLQGLLKDALAGTLATLPMTLFMFGTQRFLPRGQHYDLPPELITRDLAARAHVKHKMSKRQILGATMVSHFGYGAAMGVLYRPLEKQKLLTAPLRGSLFGLLVWAGNYLGLLPLLDMSAAGHKEPRHRNWMMVGAHLIWGLFLGTTASILNE